MQQSTQPRRVLSVGQCGFDEHNLRDFIERRYHARVLSVPSLTGALEMLARERFDLVLVNRIGASDGQSGLNLIRALQGGQFPDPPPVMLVSNLPEAQEEAMQHGALPGFGKTDLRGANKLPQLDEVLPRQLADDPSPGGRQSQPEETRRP